ncbi:hypothetical protein DD829_07780 [Chryseobacterium sp. HMWF035]|nr:hypothetical protein DBR25_11600 [Chryseobacterium sp. HMWF001]PVV57999.1 hypothetical protein DD829_07780 [Chryseobacterium sp. HMWF035]
MKIDSFTRTRNSKMLYYLKQNYSVIFSKAIIHKYFNTSKINLNVMSFTDLLYWNFNAVTMKFHCCNTVIQHCNAEIMNVK